MDTPVWIDAAAVRALPYREAMDAIAAAVRGLAIPGAGRTPPRQIVETSAGQLLMMPAELGRYAGVKLVTVVVDNPDRGLPRINGVYVLFDAATLVPVAQLDAPALTAVRTAAVSALAVDHLAPPDARRLVVFGAGPQAHAHVAAIAAVRPLASVAVVARTRHAAGAVARTAEELGVAAEPVPSTEAARVLADADLVACCTTARAPLFDPAGLGPEATVVAVGSHEPDARELDGDLVRAATVVVESRASAATAGDIVLAGSVETIVAGDLADLLAGRITLEPGRRRVFKSVGEGWQDLAVAGALYSVASGSTDVSSSDVSSTIQDR